jgi:hypothetical protein
MNSIPGTHEPDRPQLPEGWVYTDDVEWSEPKPAGMRRRLVLPGVVIALIAVCAVGFAFVNAQRHYARGVTALDNGDYSLAQTEFSAASLVGLPYRDAARLADQAGDRVRLQAATALAATERVQTVTAALTSAGTALKDHDAARFESALVSVPKADLQRVLRTDPDARKLGQALSGDVAAIVEGALNTQKWDKAESWTAALLALDPASPDAAAFTLKVKKGRELSARLADARDAGRRGEWRKALRLALGVAAVRKGFPGASSLIADARRELASQRARARAAASAAAQAAATTGAATSGSSTGASSGSSSGSSSAPAPP